MSSNMMSAIDPTKPTTFSAIFKQVSPPTTVECCVFCNLVHPRFKNLVITRGAYVEIYNVKTTETGDKYLNWLCTTPVYEEIADIIAVRFAGDSLDSLLISFPEAKVAVMNFNASTYELRTLSLHNYEFENLKSGKIHFTKSPILRLDPHQRCAVMLVYDRHLAVLPFRRCESVAPTESISNNSLPWQRRATAPLLSTFTTCLSTSTGEKINNVIDMQFLHGFYEPTLLVLYEPIGTWAGRVSARRDTCCIVALSFNLQKRTNPVIWFQESLPYDCNSILCVRQPIGQEVPLCGPLMLDGCRTVCLNETQFLIAARSGKLYLLSLWLEQATQTVTNLLLHEVGQGVTPYCMALLDSQCLFIGSRLCDSVLMKYDYSSLLVDSAGKLVNRETVDQGSMNGRVSCSPDVNKPDENLETEDLPNKRPRVEENPNDIDETNPTSADSAKFVSHGIYDFDETDVELYGKTILNPPSIHREITTYRFQVLDRLMNFGPMSQITSGEVPCLAPGNTDPTDEALTAAQTEMHHIEMIACVPRVCGLPDESVQTTSKGGIWVLHTSVRPRGLTAFELPEYVSLWSLYGPHIITTTPPPPPTAPLSSPSMKADPIEADPKIEVEEPLPENVELEEQAPPTTEDVPAAVSNPSHPGDDEAPKEESPSDTKESDEVQNEVNENLKPDPESVNETKGLVHSYLLLTREDSTMILEVSHEIVELEVSGFNTTEMTVGAFNLGLEYIKESESGLDNHMSASILTPKRKTSDSECSHESQSNDKHDLEYPYILQVSPTSLRLLDGPKLIEFVQVTLEWRIHLASCADPYVLLCTEDDELFLVKLRHPSESANAKLSGKTNTKVFTSSLVGSDSEDYGPKSILTPHLQVIRPKVGQVSAPLCFYLYHDRVGNLTRWLWTCKDIRRSEKLNEHNSSHMMDQQTPTASNNACPETSTNNSRFEFFPPPDPAVLTSPTEKSGRTDKLNNLNPSDEEDLLLYGEVIDICKKELPKNFATSLSHDMDTSMEQENIFPNFNDAPPSNYFAFIVFTNGVLEIYSVPDFTLLYEVHGFNDLPGMLVDHRGLNQDQIKMHTAGLSVSFTEDESIPPPILEIIVYPIGACKDRPILMVRTSQEVAFFEALCPSPLEASPLTSISSFYDDCLYWRRLPIPCPLVAPRRIRTDPKIADTQSTLLSRSNMLRPFEDIGGHRGVFVCGGNPVWLFSTESGQLRVFPHSIDGIMGSFAPLNASICHSGFVYFTYSNEMRLATLPPGYSFTENLGSKWISLDFSPFFAQYHVESKTYAVVGITSKPCSTIYRLNPEGNKEEEQLSRPPNCFLPSLDHYILQIYAPNVTAEKPPFWDPIPSASFEFEPWEVVTCLITAQLDSEQTFHGTKDYLALGANLSYGEEIPVRGRIIILDVIDVVPEPGQPLTRHKVKIIHDGEQKGPVTALTSCQGHLISAIGQKIYIWTLKNADLVGVAFVDSELYIHNLLCVKNLVLAADILKSVQILRFQSDLRVLSVVSRDNIPREVHTSNFFVDGRHLGFIVSDELGNVVIYSYDPLDPTSRCGRRLVRRVDMRLPSKATCCLRVANHLRHGLLSVKSAHPSQTSNVESTDNQNPNVNLTNPNKQQSSNPSQTSALNPGADPERTRHSIYFGTQSGAIFRIGPIRDKMYSRLRITEKNIIHYLGPTCGMLPKMCWPYRRLQPELANPCGQAADGDLLWKYLTLPHSQRLEIAKKSGQSLEGIMDDIAELIATTLHF